MTHKMSEMPDDDNQAMEFEQKNEVKIADLVFEYNNGDLIKDLKYRGSLISKGDFKEIKKLR